MLGAFTQGMAMGGGLIVAIGAQNAFVLTQGVKREHHLAVAATCTLCDMLLISVGVLGTGAAMASSPALLAAAKWGGAAFLAWYGLAALRSALRPGSLHTQNSNTGKTRLGPVLAAALAVSLLNPHAYLDTVVLLGGVSSRFAPPERNLFALGAMCASLIWFMCLSLGGQALAPVFRKPSAWRVLDALVCLIMWTLAVCLVV